jgi:hypothetical protein
MNFAAQTRTPLEEKTTPQSLCGHHAITKAFDPHYQRLLALISGSC